MVRPPSALLRRRALRRRGSPPMPRASATSPPPSASIRASPPSSPASRRSRCATTTPAPLVRAALGRDAGAGARPLPAVPRRSPRSRRRAATTPSSTATASPSGSRPAVRAWARAAGLRLVSFGYRNDWADAQWLDAGPEDFPARRRRGGGGRHHLLPRLRLRARPRQAASSAPPATTAPTRSRSLMRLVGDRGPPRRRGRAARRLPRRSRHAPRPRGRAPPRRAPGPLRRLSRPRPRPCGQPCARLTPLPSPAPSSSAPASASAAAPAPRPRPGAAWPSTATGSTAPRAPPGGSTVPRRPSPAPARSPRRRRRDRARRGALPRRPAPRRPPRPLRGGLRRPCRRARLPRRRQLRRHGHLGRRRPPRAPGSSTPSPTSRPQDAGGARFAYRLSRTAVRAPRRRALALLPGRALGRPRRDPRRARPLRGGRRPLLRQGDPPAPRRRPAARRAHRLHPRPLLRPHEERADDRELRLADGHRARRRRAHRLPHQGPVAPGELVRRRARPARAARSAAATGGTWPTATGAPASSRARPATPATTSSPRPPTSPSATPGSSPTPPTRAAPTSSSSAPRPSRRLIAAARADGRLALDPVDADFVAGTQAAGLRHRREGLAYRLTWRRFAGGRGLTPRKRVAPSARGLPLRRRLVYRARHGIAVWSHRVFALARRLGRPGLYLAWARPRSPPTRARMPRPICPDFAAVHA